MKPTDVHISLQGEQRPDEPRHPKLQAAATAAAELLDRGALSEAGRALAVGFRVGPEVEGEPSGASVAQMQRDLHELALALTVAKAHPVPGREATARQLGAFTALRDLVASLTKAAADHLEELRA